MGINISQISTNKCKSIFELLCCNLLWVIRSNNDSANILFTDQSILKHYLDKKYYLYDPNIGIKSYNHTQLDWQVNFGTDCETFNKAGFLHDLYKMFYIEEFVSIEKQVGTEHYCFRFFTINNRFIFINKIINDMPIVKYFIDGMIKENNLDLNDTKLKTSSSKLDNISEGEMIC